MLPSVPISSFDDFPSLAFVATRLDIRVELPLQIIPNHDLRRATPDEIAHIRDFVGYREPMIGTLVYESIPDGKGGFRRSDNADDWSYHVIDVPPSQMEAVNVGLGDIERASQLTDVPIDCPILFNTKGVRMAWGLRGLNALEDARSKVFAADPRILDARYFEELADIYNRIRSLGADHEDVVRAVDMMNQLRTVRNATPLRVLGLFAIIESLITHNPHSGYDSLGHQIKTKMKLLHRRFRKSLAYTEFGQCSIEKVWAKLYNCRSAIAHGGKLDFSGDSQVLKDLSTVEQFLTRAARSLLQQALIEPDLLIDLRAC